MKKSVILLLFMFCFTVSAQHHVGHHVPVKDQSNSKLEASIDYLEDLIGEIERIQERETSEDFNRVYTGSVYDFIQIVEATGKSQEELTLIYNLGNDEISDMKSRMTVKEIKTLLKGTDSFKDREISIETVSRFAWAMGVEFVRVTPESFCPFIESLERRKGTLVNMIEKIEIELEKR